METNYWIPEFKWQLVQWLHDYDPKIHWERKSKKQLMAIYLNLRKKGAKLNERISPPLIRVIHTSKSFCFKPGGYTPYRYSRNV